MKTSTRALAIGAVLAAASIGLAGPAWADPLSGAYSGLLTDGSGAVLNPKPVNVSFASCGPDCTRVTTPGGNSFDLHPDGGNWVGGYVDDGPHSVTVDNNAAVLLDVGPDVQMRLALTRVG